MKSILLCWHYIMESPPTMREQLFNKVFVKTSECSEKLADVQLNPDIIDLTRFNSLTDRKGKQILQHMIVSYKYINDVGQTMQVINSRVLKDRPCIEYQLPADNPKIFLSGVAEKRNDWVEDDQRDKVCNHEFELYKNKSSLPVNVLPVNVPFDIDITGSSIGKRMFGANAGSHTTRKYKKKRVRGSKKKRGSRSRSSSRKRK